MSRFEEEDTELDQQLMISDDSNSSIEDLILGKYYQPDGTLTEIDEQSQSLEQTSTITIFPETLKFPNTFPGITQTQKILLSNSFCRETQFKISITGDSAFSASESSIVVPSGASYPIIISFKPTDCALYRASIIFEGEVSLITDAIGHCIPSPLDYPKPDSTVWRFSRSPDNREITFSNKSYTLPMHVTLATTGSAFTLNQTEFVIRPLSNNRIILSYDPSKLGRYEDPTLSIKCPESGDDTKIRLLQNPPKRNFCINFGQVTLNSVQERRLDLPSAVILSEAPWPFFVLNKDDLPQSTLIVAVQSNKAGKFSAMLDFEAFAVHLTATVTAPPYEVSFVDGMLLFKNVSKETQNFQFSTAEASTFVNIKQATIRPGKFATLSLSSMNTTLVVSWSSNGKTVIDHIPIQYDTEEEDALPSETEEEEGEEEEVNSPFEFDKPFVILREKEQSTITVECNEPFSIDAPEWIEFSEFIESGTPIEMKLRDTPTEEESFLEFKTDSFATKIPIFAYSGSSCLKFNRFVSGNTLTVTNYGMRTGFIALFPDSNYEAEILISPQATVVQPGKTQQITFDVQQAGPELHTVLFTAFTGDDIIRETIAEKIPGSFYSTLFDPITLKMQDFPEEIAQELIRDYIKQTPVEYHMDQAALIEIEPTQLSYTPNRKNTVTVINKSAQTVGFSVVGSATFRPNKGAIPPNSSAQIEVKVKRIEDQTFELHIDQETFTVPIVIAEDSSIICDGETFNVDVDEIAFGRVECGGTKAAFLRIENQSNENLEIKMVTKRPFKVQRNIRIEPNAVEKIEVLFIPDSPGKYEAELEIFTEKEKKVLSVTGEGRREIQGGTLSFPTCSENELRRGVVRVVNKTQETTQMEAKVTPPFKCPVSNFSVEPMSYVLLPVHFIPKTPGDYRGVLEVRKKAGRVTQVELQGKCI